MSHELLDHRVGFSTSEHQRIAREIYVSVLGAYASMCSLHESPVTAMSVVLERQTCTDILSDEQRARIGVLGTNDIRYLMRNPSYIHDAPRLGQFMDLAGMMSQLTVKDVLDDPTKLPLSALHVQYTENVTIDDRVRSATAGTYLRDQPRDTAEAMGVMFLFEATAETDNTISRRVDNEILARRGLRVVCKQDSQNMPQCDVMTLDS